MLSPSARLRIHSSEASAFPALKAKQILRLRLRMTFSHTLSARNDKVCHLEPFIGAQINSVRDLSLATFDFRARLYFAYFAFFAVKSRGEGFHHE
jgi:hypothetical protein